MKASCMDMLLTVAFGGVAGIITGKWITCMPSHYDSTSTGLLPEWQLFNVVGYLIEERRRWPIINDSSRGQCSK